MVCFIQHLLRDPPLNGNIFTLDPTEFKAGAMLTTTHMTSLPRTIILCNNF